MTTTRALMRRKYRAAAASLRAIVTPLDAARMLLIDEEARAAARLEALQRAHAPLADIEAAQLALNDLRAAARRLHPP